jgi:CheY-like chemotaxis protein/HPt (histidine-containing phosphotransfer) domain-containing protein
MATPACLLLAEDDPVSRAFLSEALAGPAFRVDVVPDGRQALRAARATRYDLLLLDLNLPHLAAHQLLPRLRRDPAARSADAPAMVLTADADPILHAALCGSGFVAVLSKPVAMDALLEAVAAALHGVGARPRSNVPPPLSTLDWDDSVALAAANGNPDIVRALRPLMLAELPAQRERTIDALDRNERAAAAAELHRLRAACGFCGASRLARAIDRLGQALADGTGVEAARREFADAAGQLLATPLPDS